jgi:hypothetical protein
MYILVADDRLAKSFRRASIEVINLDTVLRRSSAISCKLFQNSSSRVMLVLWPDTRTECLITGDSMGASGLAVPIEDAIVTVEKGSVRYHSTDLLWEASALFITAATAVRAFSQRWNRRSVKVSCLLTWRSSPQGEDRP